MLLLLDIGNTHTHVGVVTKDAVRPRFQMATRTWLDRAACRRFGRRIGSERLDAVVVCSVVPRATAAARRCLGGRADVTWLELNHRSARSLIGIDYPKPHTIGPDRLANAIAARHLYGAPCLAVDFGTAVTLDVVNREGSFIGGVIAPGLGLMTDYLYEKTALLPRIQFRMIRSYLGRSTKEAMLVGAAHGFCGLVRELVRGLKGELGCRRLSVVATGGYANLVVPGLPEITHLDPTLTMHGLRLLWQAHVGRAVRCKR